MQMLKAVMFAADKHRDQRRKFLDEPYINHCIQVAEAARRCMLSEDAVIAGLFHDLVEDTDVTLDDLARLGCNPFQVKYVDLMSKPPGPKNPVKTKAYYSRMLTYPEVVKLKLIDRGCNLGDAARVMRLPNPPKEAITFVARYLRESQDDVAPLLYYNDNFMVEEFFSGAQLVCQLSFANRPVVTLLP